MKHSIPLLLVLLSPLATFAAPIAFKRGNVLVSSRDTFSEYTTGGQLVQMITVPKPDPRARAVGDMAFGADGRLHVINDYGAGSPGYLSTLDPKTGTWVHTSGPFSGGGQISNRGLSINGHYAFHGGVRVDLRDMTFQIIDYDLVVGTAEASVGLDGVLYAYNTGSPRYSMRRVNPSTLEFLDDRPISLLNLAGNRTNARGIGATAEGDIFVADWNGYIYRYDETVQLTDALQTGAGNNHDLDIRSDGTIIVGNRFGNVTVTNTDFSALTTIPTGASQSYVAFVTVPEPSIASSSAALLLCLIGFRRRIAPRPLFQG